MQPLASGSMASDGCCRSCYEKIMIWPHSTCLRCGIELPEAVAPGPCGHCLLTPPVQAETRSVYAYHGPVRDAVLNWKLQGKGSGVAWLLAAAMPRLRELISRDDLLIPIPMPLSRMRSSGCHHAAELCRRMAEGVNCSWEWKLLRRIGEQPRQAMLSGAARRKNLCKAFALSDDYNERLSGFSTIWIVDDILTTGSTLNYAAKASRPLIRRVASAEIKVLSLARTINRG